MTLVYTDGRAADQLGGDGQRARLGGCGGVIFPECGGTKVLNTISNLSHESFSAMTEMTS
jgi:hypothetical protein